MLSYLSRRPSVSRLRPAGLSNEWLIALRWFAFAAFAGVVAHTTLLVPRVEPASSAALWSGIALLGLVNIALTVVGLARGSSDRFVVAQIAFDVALLTALLHTVGGMANPFAPLYVFHAVLAALLLPGGTARRVIIAIAFAAGALAAVEALWLDPGCVLEAGHGQPLGSSAGLCQDLDRGALAGSGAAVAFLTLGCGLVVHALTSQVRDERNKLETVVNCIADAVLFAAPDGRIMLANRAAAALWPTRPHAATDLRVCHVPARWSEMLAKLKNPGAHEHHPILAIGDRFFEATYGRVCHDQGTPLGAVMVARDVTERLRDQAMREQRERMATIGKLAAALAHELNNPLGTIQLYTQHLLKQATLAGDRTTDKADDKAASPGAPELATEHLATVLRNADLCKRIVRDLLEYARQRPPEKRLVRPHTILVQAARTLQPHADRSQVTLRVAPDELDVSVLADADQIIQVMVNLGMNAIEALAGASGGSIELSLALRDTDVVLTATDTGPGIAEADHALVFSAFYTTKAEGTGLGLAVAQDIAAAHAGRLELISSAGQGASFSLLLPLAQGATSTSPP